MFAAGVLRFERAVGLISTAELGAAVAECLGSSRALFLVGHGIVTVGSLLARLPRRPAAGRPLLRCSSAW